MTSSSRERPRRVWQWGDVRRRNLGMWAYVLNRLTGLGLVVYLYLHLVVLTMLTRGPEGWDPFVAIAKSPAFLTLDVVLLAGLLIHSLNGIRITLNGLGLAVGGHKPLFVGLMAVAAVAAVGGAWLIFTK